MECKVCSKCGMSKALTEFHKGRGECKACGLKRHKEWRDRQGDEFRKKTLANHYKWKATLDEQELQEFKQRAADNTRARNRYIKDVVYQAYGGYRCACCGETEPLFLSLDHIHNDGYQKRKSGDDGSGATLCNQLYMQFKRTGIWRDDIQVLCMNCQHGKARNGGICPHKQRVTTIP